MPTDHSTNDTSPATIGTVNPLPVASVGEAGAVLDGGALGPLLLPRKEMPDPCRPGDAVEVFIYRESGGQLAATTRMPAAQVGQFAYLPVAAMTPVGAFLDWGLPKDLLVPYSEQPIRMVEGRSYVVYVYLDAKTDRIVASSRLQRFLAAPPATLQEGDRVDLLIYDRTDLGYKAIIDHTAQGIVYHNEVFQDLAVGRRVPGFVQKIRGDGKVDLTLQQAGYEKVDALTAAILDALRAQDGFLPISDKSAPERIYEAFGVSKKTYKKAIGALYKKRIITIDPQGIRLMP